VQRGKLHPREGHTVAQLVEALRYKPEGRGFNSWWCTGIFHSHYPSGHIVALGLTQPLTEMSTRGISWEGKGRRCVELTTLPTFLCWMSCNLGASTSWNPQGLSRTVMGLFYLLHPKTGHEGLGREQRYSSILSLTSVLGGGRVVTTAPCPLYLREWPGTHFIGGLVGSWAGANECRKPYPHRDWTLQPIAGCYTDWAIPVHSHFFIRYNKEKYSNHSWVTQWPSIQNKQHSHC